MIINGDSDGKNDKIIMGILALTVLVRVIPENICHVNFFELEITEIDIIPPELVKYVQRKSFTLKNADIHS